MGDCNPGKHGFHKFICKWFAIAFVLATRFNFHPQRHTSVKLTDNRKPVAEGCLIALSVRGFRLRTRQFRGGKTVAGKVEKGGA
jgi:hypothetical protein